MHPSPTLLTVLSATILMLALTGFANAQAADIPKESITGLESAWSATKEESHPSRRRLAMKRVMRDAADLIEKNPAAANRFDALALLLRCQQSLLSIDDSRALREEILETCRKLSDAPDAYAELRLSADILLNQTEMARSGADAKTRMQSLMHLLDRYRDTPAEGKFLQTAALLALEHGDSITIEKLRTEMEQRFTGDLDMIIFMYEKLGSEIFGGPFTGVFKSADGRVLRYPMDAMGHTTLFYLWSTRDNGEADLPGLAKVWKERKQDLAHRIEMVSINLDELPDAGASILRKHGLDWTALHLPGGEGSKFFQAYAGGRPYPSLLTVTPTGYCALGKSDSIRKPVSNTNLYDYTRRFSAAIAQEWTEPSYIAQVVSLLAGECFVVDPSTPFDPSAPPELRMVSPDAKIERNTECVPEDKLRAIQDGFIAPPQRYMTPAAEVQTKFETVVKSCQEVIASHPQAPDLWIVRNRLIVALQGLAKLDPAVASHLTQSIEVAKAAIAAPHPAGTDMIARLCLARQSLRDTAILKQRDASEIFLKQSEKPSGADISAATLLALEVGNPMDFEKHRNAILKDHASNPAMTSFVNYLLDRDHRHSLFLPPYSGGRVPRYRRDYANSRGNPYVVRRPFQVTLPTLEGGTLQIPDNKNEKWTVLVFASPWPAERGKSGSPNPEGLIKELVTMAEARKPGDVQVILAILDGDAAKTKEMIGSKVIKCPVVLVPSEMNHVLTGSLGFFDTRNSLHAVVIRPDRTIAGSNRVSIPNAVANLIAWQDEKNVTDAIAKGDLETAKRTAFTLAPLEAPTVTDNKGNVRTLPMPKINVHHLLARAKVYMAMGQWKPALTDAEAAFSEIADTAGLMSIRTPELEEVEALRDSIRKHLDPDEGK